jgi:RNA polymerase sigma factor (TIGR02999 family)
MHTSAPTLTVLLRDWGRGDAKAANAVIPLVYQDLREIARYHLRRERPCHTIQQTALIHEVYLRLLDQRAPSWEGRKHFFAMAGILMRRVLLDYSRRRNAEKRGDGAAIPSLDALPDRAEPQEPELIALADALADLERFDPQKARVVELRFFMGLSMEEISAAMRLSVRTINREWTIARAWLHAYLSDRA